MVGVRTAAMLLLGARAVMAWEHVSSEEVERVVQFEGGALVACE